MTLSEVYVKLAKNGFAIKHCKIYTVFESKGFKALIIPIWHVEKDLLMLPCNDPMIIVFLRGCFKASISKACLLSIRIELLLQKKAKNHYPIINCCPAIKKKDEYFNIFCNPNKSILHRFKLV